MRGAAVCWLVFLGLVWVGPVVGEVCGIDELPNDVRNCGTCGNDCSALGANNLWECRTGTCTATGCATGFYDLDSNGSCEYACTFRSAQEACNNVDDDCDGQVDENVVSASPIQVCGVSPAADSAECTSQVGVSCQNGAWACTFPIGVCTGASCAQTPEVCDLVDNDCDGEINENVRNFGRACASDEGLAVPGHGRCRTMGTFACDGPHNTVCNAVQASCDDLPGGCMELCDGIDNDCDGSTDETFLSKGANAAYFVKPAVTRISATRWIAQYEASRPDATSLSPGTGNGYTNTIMLVATPAPLDKTRACSEPGRLPWTRVAQREVEQACLAMGGFLCSVSEIQGACTTGAAACTYPYAPRGMECQTSFDAGTKFCNLGGSWDANIGSAGDQDAMLVTHDPELANCAADWSGLQGNLAEHSQVHDLGGNAREWARAPGGAFRPFGGSFLNRAEAAAACLFPVPTVPEGTLFDDTGFRCCFSQDPTL